MKFKASFENGPYREEKVEQGTQNSLSDYLQVNIRHDLDLVGSYLNLEEIENQESPILMRDQFINPEQSRSAISIPIESYQQKESDRKDPISRPKPKRKKRNDEQNDDKDEQFDPSLFPKNKVGNKKRKPEASVSSLAHNTYAQLLSKLAICLKDDLIRMGIDLKFYRAKPGIYRILREEQLREPIEQIFKSGKWADFMERGKAKKKQKQQNLRKLRQLEAQFKMDFFHNSPQSLEERQQQL